MDPCSSVLFYQVGAKFVLHELILFTNHLSVRVLTRESSGALHQEYATCFTLTKIIYRIRPSLQSRDENN